MGAFWYEGTNEMQLRLFIATAALLTAGQTIFAQAPQSGVGDFTIQRAFGLSGVSAPTAPTLPPPVLAGLQNGTLEVLQVFTYNSAQGTLEQFAYVVPANSPLPISNLSAAPLADHYLVQVDRSTTTTMPGASAALAGHVTSNDMPTPFGNNTGALVTLTFGYQGSGGSTQFGNIMESVSPLYNLYSATGAGTLSVTPSVAKCTVANLNGIYMWRMSGWVQTGPTSFGPYVDNGRFIADGQGNITVLDGVNINGVTSLNRNFPATYVLDDYCSGQIKFSGGSMDIQVSRDSRTVNMLFSSPSTVIATGNGAIQ